ncbi:nitrous oxide reductase family maturation protein NosD [Campylobacter sp. RM9328]|uniref:nitrous oxide reductase family maturation protein NosD n=1 Tax=Campylobacter sp. RM9328 TaxID=1705720 RepID=UPI0014741B3E|nr:nitrous oxide reductase family maturation protein NosD [Campylobacter sp. RM9328]
MKFLLLAFMIATFGLSNPLQEAINLAKDGDTLWLNDGIYSGNVVVDKAITIIGKGQNAVIKGDKTSSVIKVTSKNVKLINLNIEGSGISQMTLDAGISCLNGNNLLVEKNRIKDVLFGVELSQCNGSIIRDNNITSKDGFDIPQRGDAIRAWYSHENLIEKNYVYNSRDIVAWFSSSNTIRGNHGYGNRYAIHTMYSSNNLIEENKFSYGAVGMYFMFSTKSLVKNNTIIGSSGAFGVGIALKDVSDFDIKDNILLYNARGFYLDRSPLNPGALNSFENNQILHNIVGVQLHATQERSIFLNNDFIGNMDTAINDTPGSKIDQIYWEGNYFDEYEGYDLDRNSIGDVSYVNFVYADRLWQYYPTLRFFYGSSIISGLNFLAKLAPFSEPIKLLEDKSPKMKPNKEKTSV